LLHPLRSVRGTPLPSRRWDCSAVLNLLSNIGVGQRFAESNVEFGDNVTCSAGWSDDGVPANPASETCPPAIGGGAYPKLVRGALTDRLRRAAASAIEAAMRTRSEP
jgi:hypothetical protein